MTEIYITEKEELYTFDELSLIKEAAPEDIQEKLSLMLDALASFKSSKALFFMPKATYDLMSLFQANKSICDISADDIRLICKGSVNEKLSHKLKILLQFVEDGNAVLPVVIEADNLKKIQID
ncbi:MAG: hypothetical protein K6F15_01935 [Treponema sp.]|nr:hypothetical protein [Treponema sp.]